MVCNLREHKDQEEATLIYIAFACNDLHNLSTGRDEQLAAQSLFIDLARNEDKELSGVAGDP